MALTFDSPRLIAEIDGEFARFGVEVARGQFSHKAALRCVDQEDFEHAVASYLNLLPGARPKHAAIAIAYPVDGDQVRMTNYHWQFSIEAVRQSLGLQTLVVVNDFTALAMAVPDLTQGQRRQLGGGTARIGSVMGVLGAGVGLGVSGLIPASEGWVALGTEGGHASFAPRDAREVRILQFAWTRYAHVSFERLISNSGLELMFEALAQGGSLAGHRPTARDIIQRALDGSCAVCQDVVDVFCALLGTAAANLAVTLGAKGGIYIGGSIAPMLGTRLDHSRFRERFEDKGRFSDYLRSIPIYVITASEASFNGAAAILESQLRELGKANVAMLQRIQQGLPNFSPAERRVAEHVLAQPRKAMSEPIVDIAAAAQVSQPTVIRFCRSLGCDGLSDFKLKLAAGLSATMPITHVQVRANDSTSELGNKVLGNTASAILQARERMDWASIELAAQWIDDAGRIDVHAIGHAAAVAMDAQYKFMRVQVPCAAYTDQRLQHLAVRAMRAGDVMLVLSASGRIPGQIEACRLAKAHGARVIAVTASNSPLAKAADLNLAVDHGENLETHVAMLSRVLQLLVIDVLAVSLALKRPTRVQIEADGIDDGESRFDAAGLRASATAPDTEHAASAPAFGVTTSHDIAAVTSHGV